MFAWLLIVFFVSLAAGCDVLTHSWYGGLAGIPFFFALAALQWTVARAVIPWLLKDRR